MKWLGSSAARFGQVSHQSESCLRVRRPSKNFTGYRYWESRLGWELLSKNLEIHKVLHLHYAHPHGRNQRPVQGHRAVGLCRCWGHTAMHIRALLRLSCSVHIHRNHVFCETSFVRSFCRLSFTSIFRQSLITKHVAMLTPFAPQITALDPLAKKSRHPR